MTCVVGGGVAACRESAGMGGPLNEEEFHVIQGVLDLGRKKAFKAMTPLEKVSDKYSLHIAVPWAT